MNRLSCIVLILLLLVSEQNTVKSKLDDVEYPQKKHVRIVRDTYGIPHIYALRHKDALFGLGYIMAEDRGRQIMRIKYFAKGQIAELDGIVALENDKLVRMFNLEPRVHALAKGMSKETMSLAKSFCKGFNAYFKQHPEDMPDWGVTLKPEDMIRALMVNFLVEDALPNCYSDMAATLSANYGNCSAGAVSASRSKSGNALFVFDCHGGYEGFYHYQAHLSTPEYSVIGGFTPGFPTPSGHNGYIAWGDPQNYPDIGDVYKFPLDPNDANRYRSHDGWHSLNSREEVFNVLTASGMTQQTFTFHYTHVGPVINTEGGYIYAARIADTFTSAGIEQAFAITRAKTVAEFIKEMRKADFNNGNYLIADTQGNIGYLDAVLVPKRDPSLDWSQPVPGDDPRSEWNGYYSGNDIPELVNPASGWIQNCNNAPWYITDNSGIDKNALAYGIVREEILEMGDRGRRLSELLRSDRSVTLKEMRKFFTDDFVVRARLWVPHVIRAFDDNADTLSLRGTITERAVDLLSDWNYRADIDSRAMALFRLWFITGFVRRIETESQINDVTRLELLNALTTAAQSAEQFYGQLDPRYGDIHFLEVNGGRYPMSGYHEALDTTWASIESDGTWKVDGGKYSTFVAEMSETPKACTFIPLGQNENPGNKHYGDQTSDFARDKYLPLLFTWKEVRKKIESDITIKCK